MKWRLKKPEDKEVTRNGRIPKDVNYKVMYRVWGWFKHLAKLVESLLCVNRFRLPWLQ